MVTQYTSSAYKPQIPNALIRLNGRALWAPPPFGWPLAGAFCWCLRGQGRPASALRHSVSCLDGTAWRDSDKAELRARNQSKREGGIVDDATTTNTEGEGIDATAQISYGIGHRRTLGKAAIRVWEEAGGLDFKKDSTLQGQNEGQFANCICFVQPTSSNAWPAPPRTKVAGTR